MSVEITKEAYCHVFDRFHEKTSLQSDIEALKDSNTEISDKRLLNLAIKFLHAYVHQEYASREVNIDDIAEVFYRLGLDNHALKGFGLQMDMIRDIRRTVGLLRALLSQKIPDTVPENAVVLDIGTGTGILMLAQSLLLARSGVEDYECLGMEFQDHVVVRTKELVEKLKIGMVFQGDATKETSYVRIGERKVLSLATETLPFPGSPVNQEGFLHIQRAFRNAIPLRQRRETLYFPQRLYLVPQLDYLHFRSGIDMTHAASLRILDQNNNFMLHPIDIPKEYTATHMATEQGMLHLADLGYDIQELDGVPRALFGVRWR